MELKNLNISQIDNIYNTYMTADFPKDELKPLSHIHRMLDGGIYCCYGLFEGDSLVAYAYIVEVENIILVDYLAVLKDFRGKGIGSVLLDLLKKQYTDKKILIECENVAFAASEAEAVCRKRRISFYLNAGFIPTKVTSCLYGAEYVLLCLPVFKDTVLQDYKKIYLAMLGKEKFAKHLTVRKHN